jgi:hypothetical protein
VGVEGPVANGEAESFRLLFQIAVATIIVPSMFPFFPAFPARGFFFEFKELPKSGFAFGSWPTKDGPRLFREPDDATAERPHG